MGELIVAELTKAGYQEQDRAKLIEPNTPVGSGELVWSHSAFANQCIYLRNDGEIRCYSLVVKK